MEASSQGMPRVLCVDDDEHVLAGLRRQLFSLYEVHLAQGGPEALSILDNQGPFFAVVCDMKMPEMEGSTLLAILCERHPDTVRILLTGQSSVESAVKAVNSGGVFRFLTKPCVPQLLRETLKQAHDQHQLLTSERVLLQDTLRGCIKALGQVLEMVQPEIFGLASRIAERARGLCQALQIHDTWTIEVAAALAPLGFTTLPADIVGKLQKGSGLALDEQELVDHSHSVACRIIASIPRLEGVVEIIQDMGKGFSASLRENDERPGEELPWGARVLKVAEDFELLSRQLGSSQALVRMRERKSWYDPTLLRALQDQHDFSTVQSSEDRVPVLDLELGMELLEDVVSCSGNMLIPKGQVLNDMLLTRLNNYHTRLGIREPLLVRRVQVGSSVPTPT